MVTNSGANWQKLAYPFLLCALALHNGWEDRNMDARFHTVDDPSTSGKDLVNFSSVTPKITLHPTSYTLGFATHLVHNDLVPTCAFAYGHNNGRRLPAASYRANALSHPSALEFIATHLSWTGAS